MVRGGRGIGERERERERESCVRDFVHVQSALVCGVCVYREIDLLGE